MPYRSIHLNEFQLKFIRRIARHHGITESQAINALFSLGYETISREDRAGWYHGKIPNLSPLPAERSRFADKAERDAYILQGVIPRAMMEYS